MAKITAFADLQHHPHRKIKQGEYDTSPAGDVSTNRTLQKLTTLFQDKNFQGIISLARTRHKKVLRIRRQIKDGTYPGGDRLNKTTDRLMDLFGG